MAKEKDKDWKDIKNISPEEFELETRYVVLNFFGLVPAAGPSLNMSRGSSSNESGSHRSSRKEFIMAKEKDKDWKDIKNISPEEFEFETRYVVLNFLGLVPAAGSSLNMSRGSSSNESGSCRSLQLKDKGLNARSTTPGDECTLNQVLPTLPEMSLSDKINQHEKLSNQHQTQGYFAQSGEMDIENDDEDDTIWQSATKVTKVTPNEESEDEISIPVIGSVTPDSLEDDSLEIVKSAFKSSVRDSINGETSKDNQLESGLFFKSGGTQMHTTEDLSATPEESLDGVDFSTLFNHPLEIHSAKRPKSLKDLVPDVSPPKPGMRFEKSKSPGKRNRNSLVRTPTLDSEKSDITQDRSTRIIRENSHRSPKPGLYTQLSSSSNVTELSDIDSLMLSAPSRSSRSGSGLYVDICHVDIESLERNKADPEVVYLKQELEEELAELDHQYESKTHGDTAVAPQLSKSESLSPESKVAQYLSIIGDSVQEKYGGALDRTIENLYQIITQTVKDPSSIAMSATEHFSCNGLLFIHIPPGIFFGIPRNGSFLKAFQTVVNQPADAMDYNMVSQAAGDLTQNAAGWTKVALLMLLGKKLAYGLISRGEHGHVIHTIADYTTKILEDQVAGFIISKGGWNSIQDLDELESLSTNYTPSIGEYEDNPPPLIRPGTNANGDPVPVNEVVSNDDAIRNTDSPDNLQPSSSSLMTTSMLSNDSSVQSESSTLIGNHQDNNQGAAVGMSRDTSSDTLPSSLFSPLSDDYIVPEEICTVTQPAPSTLTNDITKNNSKGDLQLPHPRHDSDSSLHHGGASVKSLGFIVDSDYDEENDVGACGGDRNIIRQESDCSSFNHSQVEGTMDIECSVENIQKELTLLRQISTQYSEDSEPERKRRLFEKKLGMGLFFGALGIVGIMVVYRYIRKS